MKKKKKYEVGDKIVEVGQVFKIFKIKKVKNSNGELEKVIFFRPYYKTKQGNNLVCSIPVKNIKKADIRRPISREEFRQLINKLKKKWKVEEFPAINKPKELLKLSHPSDTVRLLKTLWKEKAQSENFSKSKRDIFNLAMERLVQEFALVSKVSLKEARKRINSAFGGHE